MDEKEKLYSVVCKLIDEDSEVENRKLLKALCETVKQYDEYYKYLIGEELDESVLTLGSTNCPLCSMYLDYGDCSACLHARVAFEYNDEETIPDEYFSTICAEFPESKIIAPLSFNSGLYPVSIGIFFDEKKEDTVPEVQNRMKFWMKVRDYLKNKLELKDGQVDCN